MYSIHFAYWLTHRYKYFQANKRHKIGELMTGLNTIEIKHEIGCNKTEGVGNIFNYLPCIIKEAIKYKNKQTNKLSTL